MHVYIGVDAVGVGAIAGPLVASAVAFHRGVRPPVLKRIHRQHYPLQYISGLSDEMVHLLDNLVKQHCVEYMFVKKAPWEINKDGIIPVQDIAISSVVVRLLERLALTNIDYDNYTVTINGNPKQILDTDTVPHPFKYRVLPKAKYDVWQVGAATVLATKMHIDEMNKLHTIHKQYAWDKNRGYATPQHTAAVQRIGKTKYHRYTGDKAKKGKNI